VNETTATLFGRVLAEILEREEAGHPVDLPHYIDQHPELADHLRAYFRDRDGFAPVARDLPPAPF